MKLLSISFFVTSLFFVDVDSISYGRFISIKDAPYFISMIDATVEDNKNWCGGSIISEYWVLTAAHCIDNHTRIIAGESLYNKENSSSVYRIEKMFVHGSYPAIPTTHDIALIKLKEPIIFDEYQQPIKIKKNPPQENETVVVTGFGDQGDAKEYSPVLRQTDVIVTSETTCDSYALPVTGLNNAVFCAGNGTTDPCSGDSGGPAVIDGQLAGLVSFGPECETYDTHDKNPGVYTRLDVFHDWISKMTGIEF